MNRSLCLFITDVAFSDYKESVSVEGQPDLTEDVHDGPQPAGRGHIRRPPESPGHQTRGREFADHRDHGHPEPGLSIHLRARQSGPLSLVQIHPDTGL